MKSFKAFTIMEVVVALAISAIVSTIGYFAIISIGNTIRTKNSNLSQIELIQEVRFLLAYDFSKYHNWEKQSGTTFSTTENNIGYQFLKNKIIRTQAEKIQEFNFDQIELIPRGSQNNFELKLALNSKSYNLYFSMNQKWETQDSRLN